MRYLVPNDPESMYACLQFLALLVGACVTFQQYLARKGREWVEDTDKRSLDWEDHFKHAVETFQANPTLKEAKLQLMMARSDCMGFAQNFVCSCTGWRALIYPSRKRVLHRHFRRILVLATNQVDVWAEPVFIPILKHYGLDPEKDDFKFLLQKENLEAFWDKIGGN
jgi:hypothetical protein